MCIAKRFCIKRAEVWGGKKVKFFSLCNQFRPSLDKSLLTSLGDGFNLHVHKRIQQQRLYFRETGAVRYYMRNALRFFANNSHAKYTQYFIKASQSREGRERERERERENKKPLRLNKAKFATAVVAT